MGSPSSIPISKWKGTSIAIYASNSRLTAGKSPPAPVWRQGFDGKSLQSISRVKCSENQDFCSPARKARLDKEEYIQHTRLPGEASLTQPGGKKTIFGGARNKNRYAGVILALFLLSGGCVNLSPAYAPPELAESIPAQYKEEKGWKTATPGESISSSGSFSPLDSGAWWKGFGDPVLNGLMDKAGAANQNIAVAAANLRKARARIAVARSALLPGLSLPGRATRSGSEEASPRTDYSAGLSAQWEISLWNALPALETARAEAEATAADYAGIRLSVQADLAQTYFQLRVLDVQHSLYESATAAYARAVELTRSQQRGGMVTPADVAQAETQLATAEASRASIERQRAEMEHGIAILTGQIPSGFSLEKAGLDALLPRIPPGLPSTLLERRPDVAAAERQVAAANQQIGLARAAWFPTFSLSAERLAQGVGWHSSPLLTWAVGPSAALSLFEGGRNLAGNESAWAEYEAQVANYRQVCLQAFKDVEDNLSALRLLQKEAAARERALQAARTALRLSLSQYRGGMSTYLQVVSTQTAALTNESEHIQVRGQILAGAVKLIKALGGGWRRQQR